MIFAFHGYPQLIHRLTYSRTNHDNFHVRGYSEEGTTTTPFDMVVLNKLDRFQLAMDAIDRLPRLGAEVDRARHLFQEPPGGAHDYVGEHGQRHARDRRLAAGRAAAPRRVRLMPAGSWPSMPARPRSSSACSRRATAGRFAAPRP